MVAPLPFDHPWHFRPYGPGPSVRISSVFRGEFEWQRGHIADCNNQHGICFRAAGMPDERRGAEQGPPHLDLTRLAALQKRLEELAEETEALRREIVRLSRKSGWRAKDRES
jgi:hypothetical protein